MEGEAVLGRIIEYILSPLYQLAVVSAFLYFLWGVLVFLWNTKNVDSADATKRNEGKQHMIWGLIGLFIIFSVGGIIKFLNSALSGIFIF